MNPQTITFQPRRRESKSPITVAANALCYIIAPQLCGDSPAKRQGVHLPHHDEGAGAGHQLPDKSADSGEAVGIKIPGYPSISLTAGIPMAIGRIVF
mgnify:FL=1